MSPTGTHGEVQRVADQRLFELRGFVEKEIPAPPGGGAGRGKVEKPQLVADVHVGAPDAVGGGRDGFGVFVDEREDGGFGAAGGFVRGEVGDGEREGLDLGEDAGFFGFNGREEGFQLARFGNEFVPR